MSEAVIKEEYGLVLLLDVLGIKGIWKNQNPKQVIQRWSNFTDVIKNALNVTGRKQNLMTSFNVFSDTIIITVSGDLENNIRSIAGFIQLILHESIFEDIPFRGAISLGQFYISEKMILGPAIDECSQFYLLPNCIGIIATPSYQSFLERIGDDPVKKRIIDFDYIKIDVPIKDDKTLKKFLMFRLRGYLHGTKIDGKKYPEIKTLKDLIHYKLEHLTNVEASIKLKNTLQLIDDGKSVEQEELYKSL